MRIVIINSDLDHPINPFLNFFIEDLGVEHDINLVRSQGEVTNGDALFLVSCVEKVSSAVLQRFNKTFVLHASNLPFGKGWSPHIWQILEGKEEITLSMIEASEEIDAGDIWAQRKLQIPRDAVWSEINTIIFSAEVSLMKYAINNFNSLRTNKASTHIKPSFYRKRTPNDSEIDVNLPLAEQFNLLRVCDPNRFPAFFKMHGYKYKLNIEKITDG